MTQFPGSPNGKPRKKILIVDDDSFFRTMLKDIITVAGHEVVGLADDGEVAVELSKKLSPEIVFLDLVMPSKNGLEALEIIKKLPSPPKVILCTTIKGEKVISEAKNKGIDGYVKKPFEEKEILEAIEKL